jgi:hypothetical protein
MQSTPETKLEDVSCASSSMCMAVGTDLYTGSAGKGVGQLWNGTEWKTVFSGINATPTAIDCPTTTSCLAVGTSNESTWVERWSVSGGTWSKAVKLIELPSGATKATLRDISCTSETACTAVGSYFDGTKMVALAERYTGSLILSTQTTASLSEYGEFSGVSCDGASSCTAVGRKGSGSSLLAERWNGSEWSLLSTPAKPEESGANEFNLERVSCPSASFCMAVGSYKKELARWAFAERWNGTSWSIQATPKPTGTKSTALLGVSCSSSSACAAVGRNVTASGTGEFLTTEEKTLAYSWGGSEWQLQSSTNPEGKKLPRLTGISCSASNACTAVGWATKGKGELPTVTLGERYE